VSSMRVVPVRAAEPDAATIVSSVEQAFRQTHTLADVLAWGATEQVLTAENLTEARRMCEAFDETATACAVDAMPPRAA